MYQFTICPKAQCGFQTLRAYTHYNEKPINASLHCRKQGSQATCAETCAGINAAVTTTMGNFILYMYKRAVYVYDVSYHTAACSELAHAILVAAKLTQQHKLPPSSKTSYRNKSGAREMANIIYMHT